MTQKLSPINSFFKPLLVPVLITLLIFFSLTLFITKQYTLALSAATGTLFSYMGFYHLIETQKLVLAKQKKSLIFIRFLARFVIYAAAILLAIKYPKHLHLWTILVFLFTFQVSYIIIEFIKNFKGYKKRLNDG